MRPSCLCSLFARADQDPVRDSAADFAHHQGARYFARRQGAHLDPALTPDPQGATEEAQIC
jgi:hypothetical protein